MNRGDRREAIFDEDAERKRFAETLAEVCAKSAWQVHGYVLRPSHYHLVVVETPPNLVAGMQCLLGTDTARFNRRYKLSGHRCSGRSKSLGVNGSGHGYRKTVCDYGHLNPARARLGAAEAPLRAFARRRCRPRAGGRAGGTLAAVPTRITGCGGRKKKQVANKKN